FSLFLTGSEANRKATKAFLDRHPHLNATSLAGNVTLAELAWLFSRAECVVSVNTGILHLAALAGCPTIALNGPTNPLRWGPVGEICLSLLPHNPHSAYLNLGFEYGSHKKHPCMQDLAPGDVIAALKKLGVIPENTQAFSAQ
ncbi:MAG: glycosyltransferase family 9 protein, partial [Desulfovibrio sp.]|nr:glycosyltransferase family 9 protein [Desulfovibrio sp.]